MFRKLLPRKRIFVSWAIQGRLATRLCGYWVLYHFVLWHAMFAYEFCAQRLQSEISARSFQELYQDFYDRHQPLLFCALGMMPVFLIDLFHLTHKIAGPLVRLKNALKSLTAGGRAERIRFRKGDLLMELEQTFNEFIDYYQQVQLKGNGSFRMNEKEAELIHQIVELKSALEDHSFHLPTRNSDAELPVAGTIGVGLPATAANSAVELAAGA